MKVSRRATDQLTKLRARYKPVFLADWYLTTYPDVANSDLDPLDHFVAQGETEDRDPSPYFSTSWVRRSLSPNTEPKARPLSAFLAVEEPGSLRPHPCIDPRFILLEHPELLDGTGILRALCQGEDLGQTSEWFYASEYKDLYPDLTGVQYAETHFLTRGISEGRCPRPSFKVVKREHLLRGSERSGLPVDEFWWNGEDYVVVKTGPSEAVMSQIVSQADIDPRVASAGIQALAGLPSFVATDLEARDLVDIRGLTSLAERLYDIAIVLPGIGLGGAEKYLSQVAHVLQDDLQLRVLMVVTEAGREEVSELLRTVRRKDLGRVDVVSFRDLTQRTWKSDQILALLLLAIQPKAVFVSNSEIGFECLRKYGKALSTISRPIACFFSESPFAVGAPYSARFADQLPTGAIILSDNAKVQEVLRGRLVESNGFVRFMVLPQYVDAVDEHLVRSEECLRASRWSRSTPKRILWLSRWEAFKGVDALKHVAQRRSQDSFDAYGPGTDSLETLNVPNLVGHGPLWDFQTFDLSKYDCFLFTSQFEGMPNVVLEMATRRIPVVAADVGGLRETFGDDGMDFFSNGDTPAETGERIDFALSKLFGRTVDEVESRTHRAAAEVAARHDVSVFTSSLTELIDACDLGGDDE